MSTTRYKIRLWEYDGEASVANAVTFDSFEEAEARFNDLRVSEEMPCVEFIKERIANGCIIGDEVLNVRQFTSVFDAIKIDEELLLRAGLGIGYAFAPFFRGILEGVEDYTIEQAAREMQEEHDAQEAEEGLKRPVEKTLIGDCRKCWCDQCAKLEQCVHLREGALPDGVRPFPCVGCADGMRFKPCEEERCADFEQGAGFNNG